MRQLHKILHWVFALVYVALFIVAGWKYNYLAVRWVNILGWGLIGIGAYVVVRASGQRRDEIIRAKTKDILITSGLYSYVRHPEYLGHIILIIGLIFISLHWLAIVLGLVMIAFLVFAILDEDRIMLEAFRERYSNYSRRVPMINIFLGIINKLRTKK